MQSEENLIQSEEKEFIMRKIMISIALVALMLTGCSKNEGKTTAVESIATDTVATIGDASADATTEEVVEEPAPEKEIVEADATTEAPATTEIGGRKKAEETAEEQKQNNNSQSNGGSSHSNASSNSGINNSNSANNSANSGNSGNAGNSGSSNSNNGGNSNSNNGTGGGNAANNGNATNNTPQHQHNYNVWVKTKDAYDETIEHPAEYKTVPALECHGCGQIFTSADSYFAHPCGGEYGSTETTAKQMTHDAWTETKHHDEKSHVVHHDEEGYWKCECGARK